MSLKGTSPRVSEQPSNVGFLNAVNKSCCFSLVTLHVLPFGACYSIDEGEEAHWVQVDSLEFDTFSSFPIAPITAAHLWLDLSPCLKSSHREKQESIVVSASKKYIISHCFDF